MLQSILKQIRGSKAGTLLYGKTRAMLHRTVIPSGEFGANEIVPNLWLGNIYDAHNLEGMRRNDINSVLTVIRGVPPGFPESDLRYLCIDAMDVDWEDLESKFQESNGFISQEIDDGRSVLVHCVQGKSRSATLVAAYLMRYHGMTAQEAIDHIHSKRPLADPNPGFRRQLQSYEDGGME